MNEQLEPAEVARAAMAAVGAKRRDDWLELFAPEARVEDPVGHVPPLVGRQSLGEFWDVAIGPLSSASFDVSREWTAKGEAMLLATVSIETEAGATVEYDGAFNYTVDENSKISSLRAFWDLPEVAAALTP